MIKIYNTLTGKKSAIKGKNINLFVCGPTVYDYCHIGHAKTYVAFDAFVKFLKFSGLNVFYLQNITDIDDKIINRAKEKKISPKDLADFFEKEYLKDMKELKVDSVRKYAKATNHIKEIISQVKRLLKSGYAYEIKGDGIYFDISKFKNYGKLSKRTLAGAEDAVSRIDESIKKKNKGDFCVWKFSVDQDPANKEPKWQSPFGEGRPGWHIEDTAITEKYFGPQYDIHGGARDLIFPHHEAEIAQMESISLKSPMAKYWMHTGFLTVKGQKMSKSLGNFITIQDFLKDNSPEILRFIILKTLWRSPVNYSEKTLKDAKSGLEKIEDFLNRLKGVKIIKSQPLFDKILKKSKKDFLKKLEDDFNTPEALAVMFEFIKSVNKLIDENKIGIREAMLSKEFLKEINNIFKIIDFNKKTAVPRDLKRLLEQREIARVEKDFSRADELREEIESYGFKVEDTPKGPKIKSR